MVTRRSFLSRSMLGAAALSFPSLLVPGSQAQQLRERASSRRSFEVASVESTTLKVPYREIPNRAMSRELLRNTFVYSKCVSNYFNNSSTFFRQIA